MQVIYVDSRHRTNPADSHSNFRFQLRSSLELESARFRLDNVRFTDSFYTVEETNRYVYFDSGASYTSFALDIGCYSGLEFAVHLSAKTGRSTSYDPKTNSMTMQVPLPNTLLTDAQLLAKGLYTPNSINGLLRHGETSRGGSAEIKFPFVDMQQYDDLYLRSDALTSPGVHGSKGDTISSSRSAYRAAAVRSLSRLHRT